MPPHSWGLKIVEMIIVSTVLLSNISNAADVFCGQLTIFKQQWFRKDTLTLGARMSTDLKDCLNFCCGIPDCQAVTFMGFLKNSPNPTANCVMFKCGPSGECQTVTNPVATDGVVSVVIKRAPEKLQPRDQEAVNILNTSSISNQTMADPVQNTTLIDDNTPAPTIVFGEENKDEEDGKRATAKNGTTKELTTMPPQTTVFGTHKARGTPRVTTTQSASPSSTQTTTLLADFMPIWVIGILIVITVVCAGTCLILLSVYFCVRRSKTKMRSQPITSLKTPTLHAFNPTSSNLHTTSTMA